MSRKRPISALQAEKELKKLVEQKDDRIRFGESFKSEDFVVVLKKDSNSDDYNETGKVACIHCHCLLSKGDGGQLRRHIEERCSKKNSISKNQEKQAEENEESCGQPEKKQQKIDYYNIKKFREKELSSLTQAMSKYCLRSGRSFNHMSSEVMRRFMIDVANSLSSGYGEEALKQIPCRKTIQKYSDEYAMKLIKKAHDHIRPYIMKRRVNLLCDHGKLVVNYLSVYASFIDNSFKLCLIPLAFIPCLEGKTGAETSRQIFKNLTEYGWTEEEIAECNITADGALGTLTQYFHNYIRCVSHSVNLLGANGIEPLEFQKKLLDKTEEKKLDKCATLAKNVQVVAAAARSNYAISRELSKLPSLPAETRWLSGLKSMAEIFELEEELAKVDQFFNVRAKTMFDSITKNERSVCKSILLVFHPLLVFNKHYQNKKSVTLHMVLPCFKKLKKYWERLKAGELNDMEKEEVDIEYVQCLTKSALLAHDKYYKEFNNVHYAAVMLFPKTKRMNQFTQKERKDTRKYLLSLLPTENIAPAVDSNNSKKENALCSFMTMSSDDENDEDETPHSELDRYLNEWFNKNSNETPKEYWRRKEYEYPNLFNVAASIFSVVPSESICESCFSTASFLLDKRRTRLSYSRAELVVVGSQIASKYPDWLDGM